MVVDGRVDKALREGGGHRLLVLDIAFCPPKDMLQAQLPINSCGNLKAGRKEGREGRKGGMTQVVLEGAKEGPSYPFWSFDTDGRKEGGVERKEGRRRWERKGKERRDGDGTQGH